MMLLCDLIQALMEVESAIGSLGEVRVSVPGEKEYASYELAHCMGGTNYDVVLYVKPADQNKPVRKVEEIEDF